MIEILKHIISMAIDVFNKIFFIPIKIYDNVSVPAGVLIISFLLLCVLLLLILNFLNINIGGDDE